MHFRTALLLAGLTLSARSAAAQSYAMDRGVWQLGGTAGISHYHNSGSSGGSTTYFVSPQTGFFVAPGLAVTADAYLSHTGGNGFSATAYGVGPGLAYYFGGASTRVHPFVTGSVLLARNRTSNGGAGVGISHGFNWTGSGGLAAMLARNVALTGELYYTHFHSTFNTGSPAANSEQYGSRFGVAVYLY